MIDTQDTTKILHTILDEITMIKSDISSIKSDVSELKSDVSELKSDVSELKSDMISVKSELKGLKSQMDTGFDRMETSIDDLRDEVRSENTLTQTLLGQAFEHISEQMASADQSIQPSLIFRHSRSRTRTAV